MLIHHQSPLLSTTKPLKLLHIDLFRPIKIASLGGNKYSFVIVDNFSKFTWVLFLTQNDESFETFQNFYKNVKNEKDANIIFLRSNHARELKNELFKTFFFIRMASLIIFSIQNLLNKIELFKGKI